MAQSNTIGGSGSPLSISFTEYGSSYSDGYVNTLVSEINNLLIGGTPVTDVPASNSGSAFFPTALADGSTPIYNLVPSNSGTVASQNFTIATAGYVIDTVNASNAVNLASSGGDTVVVISNDGFATINSAGADNLITFIDGNNVYNGGSSTGDTVVGGTGNDTINTGSGNTTVNAGTGYDVITLNDAGAVATGSFYNDGVFLDTGHADVIANGVADYVVATAAGQTITGGPTQTSASNLTAVLLAGSSGDQVTGAAGYLTVIDQGGGNTITGGTGGLTFIGGANVSDAIGTGAYAQVFGGSGDDLTLSGAGGAVFSAGAGNETLDGSAATGNLTLFGAASSDTSAVDSLVGGAGNDTLVAGGGTDTLTGGAGSNIFLIDAYGAQGGNITITDFAGNDSVAFGHYSAADVNAAIANGTQVGDNFVITFATSDTTVTFDNATSASLTGHTITFS